MSNEIVLKPTHWCLIRTSYFSGNAYVVDRRNTYKAINKAKDSFEYYNDPSEYYYEIRRSDDLIRNIYPPVQKEI